MTVQASLGNLMFGLSGNLGKHSLPGPGSLISVWYCAPIGDARSHRWEAEAQSLELVI